MKLQSNSLVSSRISRAWSLASALIVGASAASAAVVVLDFEGVPPDFNYDVGGLSLGGYFAGESGGPSLIGGPFFGPQATVLEVGGSLNVSFPPKSGIGVLWGEGLDIELTFTAGLANSVSLYYRSNADLYLFAYDSLDNLLGSTSGPGNLAPDPEGFLDFDAGAFDIARILISGPGGAFIVDDVTYDAVPEPHEYALIAGLGLVGFAVWRRRS